MQGSHAEERASLPHGWGPRALGFLPLSPLAGLSTAPKCCPSLPRLPEYSSSLLQVAESSEGQTPHSVLRLAESHCLLQRGWRAHT